MVDPTMPATLNDAVATEPLWLQAWIMLLVVATGLAVLFVVGRRDGRWKVRLEPLAVLASLVGAAILMNWLYARVGYVRLLGLGHLVFWTPVWLWIFSRRRSIGTDSLYGKWVVLYLVVAGICLAIDLIDVVRYLAGDGSLLGRWG